MISVYNICSIRVIHLFIRDSRGRDSIFITFIRFCYVISPLKIFLNGSFGTAFTFRCFRIKCLFSAHFGSFSTCCTFITSSFVILIAYFMRTIYSQNHMIYSENHIINYYPIMIYYPLIMMFYR